MKILAIVNSLTGNTMSFIEYVKEIYGDNVYIDVISPEDEVSEELFNKYDKLMLGCYTWGVGKIPIKMKKFVIENREILLNQDILVFGSGWSIYEDYCGAVDSVCLILNEKFPRLKFELRFDPEVEIEAIKIFEEFIKN